MRQFADESDFQKFVMDKFSRLGHVQDHRHSAQPGIPDMSAAAFSRDYWLEAKFGRFSLAAGRQGRDYDRFVLKETTRLQLDWLSRRGKAGNATCGILAYLRILPLDLTHYVFYMDADLYLDFVHKDPKLTIGAILLMPCVENMELIGDDPRCLSGFIDRQVGWRPKGW